MNAIKRPSFKDDETENEEASAITQPLQNYCLFPFKLWRRTPPLLRLTFSLSSGKVTIGRSPVPKQEVLCWTGEVMVLRVFSKIRFLLNYWKEGIYFQMPKDAGMNCNSWMQR